MSEKLSQEDNISLEPVQAAFEKSLVDQLYAVLFDAFEDRSIANISRLLGYSQGQQSHLGRNIKFNSQAEYPNKYEASPNTCKSRLMPFLRMGACFGISYPKPWTFWTIRACESAYAVARRTLPPRHDPGETPTWVDIIILHQVHRELLNLGEVEASESYPQVLPLQSIARRVNRFTFSLLDLSRELAPEEELPDLNCDVEEEFVWSTFDRFYYPWPIVEKACHYEWIRMDS